MKKQLTSLSLFLSLSLSLSLSVTVTPVFADFGKVVDSDGYVNMRADESSNSDVKGRVSSGEFVYFNDEDIYKNWLFIYPTYQNSGKEGVSGYIHKSRIDPINQDNDGNGSDILMTYFDKKNNLIKFTDNGVSVTIQAEDFDYESHINDFTKKHYSQSWGDGYYLSHYKGQYFWGTDGSPPKDMNHYIAIKIQIGNQTINIPKNEVESLFGIGFTRTNVYYERETDSVYISALEGYGAGSYQVLFAIENGKYVGKTVVIPF